MNKRTVAVLLFTFILSVGAVKAEEGDLSIGAAIGEAGLVGNGMGSYGTNGLGFGGFISYGVSYLFDLDMSLVYASHESGGNKATSMYFTPALKFLFAYEQLIPYITAGVGFYRNNITAGTVTGSATSFGFNIGGGVDVTIGKYLVMGVLVRYHPVFDKTVSSVPAVADFWDAMFRIGFSFNTGVQSGWD